MKALVTGCAGLIGSHLVDLLLEQGYEVVGVDNLSYGSKENIEGPLKSDKFKFYECEVRNMFLQGIFFDHKFDAVFHLATLKKTFEGVDITPWDVMDNSIEMAREINNLMINSKDAFLVFSSTSDVYSNSDTFRETERLTIGPTNISRYSYAMTKMWEEQYYLNQILSGKYQGAIARIFGCTSPRASKSWSGGHIPLFLDRAMRGEPIEIHGDGTQTRSISHAKSIAFALYRMAQERDTTNGEIINLGSDQQVSVRTAAEMVIGITESTSEIRHLPAKQVFGDYPEITRRWADTTKAKKMLGVNFDKTLRDIIIEMNEIWKSEE